MLIEFSVGNFLSFKERVTFSMVASYDKHLREENVIKAPQGTKLDLLKTAAIYGANASGKSNLVKAMAFMKDFILKSSKKTQSMSKIGVTPFKLDSSYKSKPSEFEIIFLLEGVRYQYGFVADSQKIYQEWLYSFPKNQKRMLFKRDLYDEDGIPIIEFGPHWKGEKDILKKSTRSNALFLSVADQLNQTLAGSILRWFSKNLIVSLQEMEESKILDIMEKLANNRELQGRFLKLLKLADLRIIDLQIPYMKREVLRLGGSTIEDYEDIDIDIEEKIELLHEGIDEKGEKTKVSFKLYEESDGTRRFIELADIWIDAILYNRTMIIDELDFRLHPLLTKSIIGLFQGKKDVPKNPQIIFTTHDSSLLDKEFFRRDQIWFTEKDHNSGATEIYSLWDFKIRKEENYEKGYLMGRYGAIPFLGDL